MALHPSATAFAESLAAAPLPSGPLGVVVAEEVWQLRPTAERLAAQGAAALVILTEAPERAAAALGPAEDLPPRRCVAADLSPEGAAAAMNRVIDAFAGRWIAWAYNGEALFYPFCETRRLGDIAQFLSEERRRILFAYTFDLYAPDLPGAEEDPAAAGLSFDRIGYYAFPGEGEQVEIFGGLGWRFEEFLPAEMMEIGRASLFLAEAGVHMGPGLRFSDPAYNSVACPWHHSPTGAVMSLRRARYLFAQPGFQRQANRLLWRGSAPFAWRSQGLLEAGMMEPGQWF